MTLHRVLTATEVRRGRTLADSEAWASRVIVQMMVVIGEGRPSVTDLVDAMQRVPCRGGEPDDTRTL